MIRAIYLEPRKKKYRGGPPPNLDRVNNIDYRLSMVNKYV